MYKPITTNLFLFLLTFFVSTSCSDNTVKEEKMITASHYVFSKIFPRELQEIITSFLGFWEYKNTFDNKSQVNCLAFSNDGKYLAAGVRGDTLKIWNLTTNKLKNSYLSDAYVSDFPAVSVVFSSNAKYLAVGYNDGRINIIDLDDDTDLFLSLFGHDNVGDTSTSAILDRIGSGNGVMCLAYSNDGKLLASGSKNNSIKLYDMDNTSKTFGKCFHTVEEHTSGVRALTFSNDNLSLVSGSLDTTAKIWDIKSLKLIQTLDHNRPVVSLAYSSDGKLATGSTGPDHTQDVMNIWDPKTGELLKQIKEKAIFSVAYRNDGKYLANIGPRRLRVHDVDTKAIQEIFLDANAVQFNLVAFSKDGKYLAASFKEGDNFIIRIWTNEDPNLTKLIKIPEEPSNDNL